MVQPVQFISSDAIVDDFEQDNHKNLMRIPPMYSVIPDVHAKTFSM